MVWLKQEKVQLVKEMERSRPKDVAVFALYLSSEEAANITGRRFFVGGETISLYSEPDRIRAICRDTDGEWKIDRLKQIVPQSLMESG